MHYVIHVSQAAQLMSAAELESLLTFSRASNTEKGISGLLICRQAQEADSGTTSRYAHGGASAPGAGQPLLPRRPSCVAERDRCLTATGIRRPELELGGAMSY